MTLIIKDKYTYHSVLFVACFCCPLVVIKYITIDEKSFFVWLFFLFVKFQGPKHMQADQHA